MGIPGYMGIGFAGGAVAGMAVIGRVTHNSHVPELAGIGTMTGAAGAVAGLATGVLARNGAGGVKSALAGTALAMAIPGGLLAYAVYLNRHGDGGGGWGDLAAAAGAMVLGVGVAGGGVALVGHALMRH